MHLLRVVVILLIVPPMVAQARAAEPDGQARRLPAIATTGPIVVDGRLDEPDWQRAPVATGFVQSEPDEGEPASERTDVRVLYDEETLYVGAFAHHRRVAEVIVNELNRDFNGASTDWMAVIVDTFHDRRNGYQFGVNPRGAAWDSQKFNLGRERNLNWDGAWTVRTTIVEDGWYAEFAIPFRTLQVPRGSSQTWGLNFQRHLQGRLENSFWAPVPRQYGLDRVSLAGTLEGLQGISTGINLRVKPYVLGRRATGPRADTLAAGMDLKLGVTPGLTADLTINTDFSQVEADVQQVGATRFSVRFPEKREFFLENSGIFQFGPGNDRAALVSAAPGLSAGGRDNSVQQDVVMFFSRRIGLSATGEERPIAWGARLSGHIGGVALGGLRVRQQAEGADPDSDFSVLRLRRSVGAASDVGVIVLDRADGDGAGSRAAGVDANLRPLPDLLVYGYAAQAFDGGQAVPDGSRRAARTGVSWHDTHWAAEVSYGAVGPGFENGLGFVPRAGIERRQALLGRHFRPRAVSAWLRDLYPAIGWTGVRRDDGRFDSAYGEQRLLFTFRDGTTVELGANPNDETLATPFVVDAARGVVVSPGRYRFTDRFAEVSTTHSRRFSLHARVSGGDYYDGTRQVVQLSAAGRLNVHLSGSLSVTRDDVALPLGRAASHVVAARVNGGFSTRAFLNALVQFNSRTRQWDANVRFNLIHRPLSDLFVVFSEQREGEATTRRERRLVVKATRLFSF